MEQFMVNAEMKDDFIVESIETITVDKTDADYDEQRPMVTHGIARRADGAVVSFVFMHGQTGIISSHVNGAQDTGNLRIGFYLRKECADKPTESKIISLADFHNKSKLIH